MVPLDPNKEEGWFSDSGFSAWNRSSPPTNWSGGSDDAVDAPSVNGLVPRAGRNAVKSSNEAGRGVKRSHDDKKSVANAAPSTNSFNAAFVLPVTRDGRALLTRERRGKEEKLGLLGGKAMPGEGRFACMAREAKEESGGALSEITLLRMGRGAGQLGEEVYFDKSDSVAIKHDLVVPEDLDVDTRFDPKNVERLPDAAQKKKKSKAPTVQTGLEFVSLEKLRDQKWRGEHMHFNASVLCARLMKSM